MKGLSGLRRSKSSGTGAMRPLADKTFVLGVGAQKAGTSWLYAYLAAHPACGMPRTKELHVFDVVHVPKLYRSFATEATSRLLTQLNRAEGPDGVIRPSTELREARAVVAAQQDVSRYPLIFRDLPQGPLLTGDITPAYAALDAAQFDEVRSLLTTAGARPRVVFLMRDPVERFYSAARMWARRTGTTDLSQIQATFQRQLSQKAHLARGRYDLTVAALEGAFHADELFFDFYETLFTQPTIKRLCGFLDIPYAAADFETRVNVTDRQGDLPADLLGQARAALDPVYRFCRERFGDAVPKGWHP